MATLTKGYTFGATEQVTNAKLHSLVDSATLTSISGSDIASDAAIASSKLATISTAGKVDGAALTGLASIPSGAGVIPAANLTSVAQKGANSDITSLTGLTTALSTAQGGTGATAAANAASGVVVPTGAVNQANGAVILTAAGKYPALDGSLITGISSDTTKYGCRAYRVSASGGQSLSGGAPTKAALDGETFDINNEYDKTTNYRYTASVAGYYQVNASLTFYNASVVGFIEIWKNGTVAARNKCEAPGAGAYASASISDIIYLAINDYIELYFDSVGHSTTTIVPESETGLASYLSVMRIK